MKKKNIIKKLLSVVLSAATVFSLLTLPAHAIVPGEDAYGGQGYVYVDYANKKTEYVPQSAVPTFTGTSTYDALNNQDRSRMEQMNVQIMQNLSAFMSPTDITTGSYNYITPSAHYTGVVLIAVFREGVYCGHGTGFMVDSDTFVTALHVVAEETSTGAPVLPLDYEDEIRVYFGISEDIGTLNVYEFFEDPSLDYYSVYSGMYAAGDISEMGTMNDWYVGNLNDCVTDDIYFFDCYHSLSSIVGTNTYIVGYPGAQAHLFRMVETYGQGTIIDENKEYFATSNRTEAGMSGGPVYTVAGGIKCAGILVTGNDDGGIYSSFGVTFHREFMNAITWYIN